MGRRRGVQSWRSGREDRRWTDNQRRGTADYQRWRSFQDGIFQEEGEQVRISQRRSFCRSLTRQPNLTSFHRNSAYLKCLCYGPTQTGAHTLFCEPFFPPNSLKSVVYSCIHPRLRPLSQYSVEPPFPVIQFSESYWVCSCSFPYLQTRILDDSLQNGSDEVCWRQFSGIATDSF